MPFDWWTFAFQLVNVLILLWLLSRFLFRPTARIIAERKATAAAALRQAEEIKAKSEEALKALQQEREETRKQRFDVLEAARAEAEKQKGEALAQARRDAVKVIDDAGKTVERNRAAAEQQQLQDAVTLSATMTERLLGNLPEDARFAGYAKRLEDALSALDEEKKAALLSEPGALELISARKLTKAERAQARKAAAVLTGREQDIPIVIDETLIAGLELRSPNGVVHNSLRFDLERISKALADETR